MTTTMLETSFSLFPKNGPKFSFQFYTCSIFNKHSSKPGTNLAQNKNQLNFLMFEWLIIFVARGGNSLPADFKKCDSDGNQIHE